MRNQRRSTCSMIWRFNEAGSVRSRKLQIDSKMLRNSRRFNEAGSVRSRKPPTSGCHPAGTAVLQ